ncbi:MAG: hypothetical protein H0X38_18980 [Planctomycetes bacterium]|nr:hypothetical protein [Planctomycetota bacterium]
MTTDLLAAWLRVQALYGEQIALLRSDPPGFAGAQDCATRIEHELALLAAAGEQPVAEPAQRALVIAAALKAEELRQQALSLMASGRLLLQNERITLERANTALRGYTGAAQQPGARYLDRKH